MSKDDGIDFRMAQCALSSLIASFLNRLATFQKLTIKGWQRTGAINVACLFFLGVLLLVIFIVSIARPGASLDSATVIYRMNCNNAAHINLIFHLLINLVSTGIFASANFFMQIITSPSRAEIDKAHSQLRFLDVGIPSPRNLEFLPTRKRIAWGVLLLSSIPIHLLFNSSIFDTVFRGSEWHLTIATESFTQGASYYTPGASLSPSGSSQPSLVAVSGYGRVVPLAEYWNSTSPVSKRLMTTAKLAPTWERVNAADCRALYAGCHPRKKYGDVIIVVESKLDNRSGWTREQVFDFESRNLTTFWDPHVPHDEINSLWFFAECSVSRSRYQMEKDGGCTNTCARALGTASGPDSSEWLLIFQHPGSKLPMQYGYDSQFNNFTVDYCLAEPLPGNCKVILSNQLILAIIVCVFIKAITCAAILWKARHKSLVTIGDVMESFITRPDQQTVGLCTLDNFDCCRLMNRPPVIWSGENGTGLTTIITPRAWQRRAKRLIRILPGIVWARTYSYLSLVLALVAWIMYTAFQSNGRRFPGPFGRNDDTHIFAPGTRSGFVNSLLFINIPHLFVSICYFFYNACFTQLQAEHDWNEYSLKFKPLHVSYPTGQQISTYRLQLPYKYSIPLLLGSVLCHWLVSNTVFLFVIEGGYEVPGYFNALWVDERAPGGLEEGVSYSTSSTANDTDFLRSLSQSKVKWGATPIPSHVEGIMHDEDRRGVMHLVSELYA
ncbi:hypothetical protein HD806DRAFT_525813 [Xylariaceae sp. AK1471]|nr:hypothetical protein HD806DRAFT_525813 [Xylariaceae sp. AK1471]